MIKRLWCVVFGHRPWMMHAPGPYMFSYVDSRGSVLFSFNVCRHCSCIVEASGAFPQ